MGFRLGMNGALYYKTGGYTPDALEGNKADLTAGVGTLLNVTKDNTLGLEKAEADVTTRGNNGWRATVGTLKNGNIDMQIQWDPDDAAFTAIMNAWLTEALMGFAVLDEAYVATTAGTGLIADFSIINFTREEGLEDAMMANVTAKPTYSTVVPGWLVLGDWA